MPTRALDAVEAPPSAADLDEPRASRVIDGGCRLLDVVVAGVALVALAPLLLLIAVAVRLESPGGALFAQRRIGRAQVPFTLYKFRTMRTGASPDRHREFVQALIAGRHPPGTADAAHDGPARRRGGRVGRVGPRFKLTADDRITRVGRVLRSTSLDELPQLWNVIRGEMSLVGPRPPIPYEVEQYPPHWLIRFAVKPGLTGLWQVSGRCELSLHQMIALDVEYVRRRSLWLNLVILLRTVPVVITRRGAS